MRKVLLPTLIISSFILNGCWDQQIYEQTGFILQVGIEKSKIEDQLLVTFTSPVLGAQGKEKVEILSTVTGIVRGARENTRRMSGKALAGGKVQQVVLSEEIAKLGMHNLTEVLQRDPTNPSLAWVVVVEGSPLEMFEKASKFQDKPRPAMYLNQLLETNVKSSYIPQTRVYDFDLVFYADGIDPMTPLVRLNKEEIMVVGSALFSGDKMVGRIDHKHTSLLLAMRGMLYNTELILYAPIIPGLPPGKNLEAEKHLALLVRGCKRKIDVKIENGKPKVNMSMKFNGILDNYRWDHTADPSVQKALEKNIEDQIKDHCTHIADYLKEVGSDPIGIGDIVRARHNKYWKSVDWKEAYKEAEFDFNIEFEIMQFGDTE